MGVGNPICAAGFACAPLFHTCHAHGAVLCAWCHTDESSDDEAEDDDDEEGEVIDDEDDDKADDKKVKTVKQNVTEWSHLNDNKVGVTFGGGGVRVWQPP